MKFPFLCGIFFILGGLTCKSQSVVFNEVMQSNVDYLLLEKDYPDSWVELYNISNDFIDIKGYYIGLSNNVQTAYQIPCSTVISPKGFLIICCDKENRLLHTNFRIDSGKGDLYLFDARGYLVDELHLKKMPAPNIAYGRLIDGSGEWQYELEPSAGKTNTGKVSNLLLPDPVFSMTGGIFNTPINVSITMPEGQYPEDTKIYITTDGSEPTPLSISGTEFSYAIDKTTILRAKLISSTALSPRSLTNSYIFHPRAVNIPIISLVSDNSFFYSDELGIFVGGDNPAADNCFQKWRRPLNAELYSQGEMEGSKKQVFNQLCETAIAGNYSRIYPQKSLKLYAHKRWGKKKFEGNLWEEKPEVNKVKSFMLRNGGSSCLYGRFNDALIQRVFGNNLTNLDWQGYEPIIVYINGVYKGLYELRERSDEDYVESNYSGIEDIEIVNEEYYYNEEVRKNSLFSELYDIYTRDSVTYEEIADKIDFDNFISSLIVELYSTNFDYPYNNISIWRPISEGGQWRWILKDIDYTALRKKNSYDMFKYIFGDSDTSSEEYLDSHRDYRMQPSMKLYQVLLSYPQVREYLIERFSVYLGDFLKPNATSIIINEMADEIDSEMPWTLTAYPINELFPDYMGYEPFDSISNPYCHYKKSIDRMLDFWNERPAIIYSQMKNYFNLGDLFRLTITKAPNEKELSVNGIDILTDCFDGYYYADRTLRLKGMEGYGWQIEIEYISSNMKHITFESSDINLNLGDYAVENDSVISVRCTPTPSESNSLKDIDDEKMTHTSYYYDLRGIRIYNPVKGRLYIRRTGAKYEKLFY